LIFNIYKQSKKQEGEFFH